METAAIHYQGSSAPAQSIESTRVVTGVVRLSYAHIWQPQSFNGGTPKYSVSIIIPKSNRNTIDRIERAIAAAYREGSGKLKGSNRSVPPLSALKTPLRDGDLERPDDEAYANAFFLNATSNRAPQIVDLDCREIDDEAEVYSGVYARVSLNFYAFSVNGNRGIAAGLNNIQKVRDGEPLGNVSAAQDFAGEFSEEADEDVLIPF